MSLAEKTEKFAMVKKALDEETHGHIESIKICFDLMEKAIERNFKIQSTLGTFCLVGIFTLLSWGKIVFTTWGTIPITKVWLIVSVSMHTTALFLLAYKNALSAELQVWKQQLHNIEFAERVKLISENNAALSDNQIYLYPTTEELKQIAIKVSEPILNMNNLAPKIFKLNRITNWIFFVSIISTLLFVLLSLKIDN